MKKGMTGLLLSAGAVTIMVVSYFIGYEVGYEHCQYELETKVFGLLKHLKRGKNGN